MVGYYWFGWEHVFLGMIMHILIFLIPLAIIFALLHRFDRKDGNNCDYRIANIEKGMSNNRDKLDKILQKLE